MKKTILLSAILMLCECCFALKIHQVRISEFSQSAINISLDTEAKELYYFQSWQYQVVGNSITIKAFYIEGFGSTIAYLNNNFQIAINPGRRNVYQLNIKVYYTNLRAFQNLENVQDQWSGSFSTPLSAPIFLTNSNEENPLNISYQNPNSGLINVGPQKINLDIFDDKGNVIQNAQVNENFHFTHLPDGLYYFRFSNENTTKIIRMILKK